ncbi:MAG: glycoside hydrolase family 15 protein [Actinobacteria bacterium]|nr:glycoside hydrolase family 15 protein [Actinomycetota bacterium]
MTDPYPPIGDYAVVGDCHSAALVSRDGSIDWCCLPRLDAGAAFGRLLDWGKGGFCSLRPDGDAVETSRRYLDGTLVLVTTFAAAGGRATLTDCMTMHTGGASDPHHQVLRVVEGESGRVTFRLRLAARFDYGGIRPWIRRHGADVFSAVGGDDALVVSGDVPLEIDEVHDLVGEVTLRAGERARLSITWSPPERIDPHPAEPPGPAELDRRLNETVEWWRRWSDKVTIDGPDAPGARRSAVVLKGLTNAPTGAVAAAVTTSLPEAVGAGRNWDYRFSWVRDSQFTVRSLGELGCTDEADGFRRFIERSAAGGAESLQIMYGVGGQRRLTEVELPGLEGYRRSSPVRVGNAAADQLQLDVFGELLELAWRWHRLGQSPDDDYWRFLLSLVDVAAERWDEPDRGIWEMRGEPRHFVHSKVMCWVALERGLALADECLRRAPTRRWRKARDQVREAVEDKGYDHEAGTFVSVFGSTDLDAALLLLPSYDFVDYRDERMVRTVDAIRDRLGQDGLLRRYDVADGLDGEEGCFVACSFWLAECLARQGRALEARDVFDRTMATANDLGLFAEEYDPRSRELLGNFPQGLSHLSHVAAAVALAAGAGDGAVTP